MRIIPRSFFARDSREAAPELIGKRLHLPSEGIIARIVEVEAYRGAEDPAAHSYRGKHHALASCSDLLATRTSISITACTGR